MMNDRTCGRLSGVLRVAAAIAFVGVVVFGVTEGVAKPQAALGSDTLLLKNQHVLRELKRDGNVWRTVRFARADGSDELKVRSDEFHILLMDDTQLTLDHYTAQAPPAVEEEGGAQTVSIVYVPRKGQKLPPAAPRSVTVTYTLADGPYLRKDIVLQMGKGQAIDRLQVERFVTKAKMRRGGRGEPVFFDEAWFGGLEYPASYVRHGKDFQYRDYKLRNPSKILLEGRDEELGETPAGLVTMAHFPGLAKDREAASGSGEAVIVGKTSVFGVGKSGDTIELALMDYVETIRRGKPRSYLHHNNWYDASGKNLSVENYIGRTYAQLRDGLAPYGVTLDGMVPDNGWQDRNSIWRTKGGVDLPGLRDALAKDGGKTRMGLWIAMNGYSCNTDWGVGNGYAEAKRNEWFTRFKRYYSLTHPKYNTAVRAALKKIIADGNLSYFKHDFNEMCDVGEGRGHLPTDRHGHEANVDAMIELLAFERQCQPDIYQNMTNWIWFSPWWLMHNDCLWMMGSDAGSNWSWPQLAVRDISTTFRDEHFARLWRDPLNRPLIPISTLMTHGIIFSDRKSRGDPKETLGDWSNYVVTYYGRGVMLKELYITPSKMTPERWKVLGMATRWAVENAPRLVNTIAVAGNPERGELHGYVSWTDGFGILTLRNPDRRPQTASIPFHQTTWYRGPVGQTWRGRVIHPYVEPMGRRLTSGKPIEIRVPGDSVMIFEFRPGEPAPYEPLDTPAPPNIRVARDTGRMTFTVPVPDEDMLRCDLVLQVFQGVVPPLTLDGKSVQPDRLTRGTVKAKQEIRGDGELAPAAKPKAMGDSAQWAICSVDLRPHRGRTVTVGVGSKTASGQPFAESGATKFDAWFIADRAVKAAPAPADEHLPFAIGQDHRRQTVALIQPTQLTVGGAAAGAMGDANWKTVTAAKVRLRIFGVSGGPWGPVTLQCNGADLVRIPANKGGDRWETVLLDVPAEKLKLVRSTNTLRLVNPKNDKFKVAGLAMAVRRADGTWAASPAVETVYTSSDDWKHAQGEIFPNMRESQPIAIEFKVEK